MGNGVGGGREGGREGGRRRKERDRCYPLVPCDHWHGNHRVYQIGNTDAINVAYQYSAFHHLFLTPQTRPDD